MDANQQTAKAKTRGWLWKRPVLSPGDPCPECGRPLELGTGRGLGSFFLRRAYLACMPWPQCGFAKRYRE
jgi:hypothetical protein